ncbi:hypothetical protein NM688_g4155 [Phlebia brevispora]|uniref:Uncharacterized protein n=1 Tax=Phlebia brevispora TaxID=194682 RepID=A0ACC1T3T7_9APHY|nr:hypothetical protein NM688_g4155 [Phlebia brevispora]
MSKHSRSRGGSANVEGSECVSKTWLAGLADYGGQEVSEASLARPCAQNGGQTEWGLHTHLDKRSSTTQHRLTHFPPVRTFGPDEESSLSRAQRPHLFDSTDTTNDSLWMFNETRPRRASENCALTRLHDIALSHNHHSLTNMFRVALLRVATRSSLRPSVSLRATRPAMRYIRSEAPNIPEDRRKFLEERDDLQRDWDAKEITYEQLKPRTLQPTPDAYLIDVREKDEVMQGSIPSAVNLPLSELSHSFSLKDAEFERTYGFPKPKPDQELIFYCRSGKRSTSACDVAKRNGYKNLLNYKGSWLDWTEQERGTSTPSP